MSRTFDELMKVLEEKGEIPDEQARAIIAEHGPLSDEEKKQIAAAIRMKKALTAKSAPSPAAAPQPAGEQAAEVSMDDYLQALSILDSSEASEEEKQQARRIVERFESQ